MEKEIVLYRTFDSSVEANIVKDVLETNGVPCFLSNEIFSSVLPLTNSSVGAIRQMSTTRSRHGAKSASALWLQSEKPMEGMCSSAPSNTAPMVPE